MEIGRDMRRALEAIDPEDPAKTDKAQIEKLLGQVKGKYGKTQTGGRCLRCKIFTKALLNATIGRIRTYLAGRRRQ